MKSRACKKIIIYDVVNVQPRFNFSEIGGERKKDNFPLAKSNVQSTSTTHCNSFSYCLQVEFLCNGMP